MPKATMIPHAELGDIISPQYQAIPGAPYYRMPKEGPINDGVRIDKGASKWGLQRQDDGSVLVGGKTIRLKVFSDLFMEAPEIIKQVETVNPKWDYDVARQLGAWCPTEIPQWCNVEITSYVSFLKSARKDPFIGYVVRSCIHDLATDKELKGRPDACHAGSAYHSNLQPKAFEEKIEFYHAGYGKMLKSNYIKKIPKFGREIYGQKVGFKFCLYNSMKGNTPIVKSETYMDWSANGKFELAWAGFYTGKEKKAGKAGLMTWGSPYIILKSNVTKYKLYDLEIKEIVAPPVVTIR